MTFTFSRPLVAGLALAAIIWSPALLLGRPQEGRAGAAEARRLSGPRLRLEGDPRVPRRRNRANDLGKSRDLRLVREQEGGAELVPQRHAPGAPQPIRERPSPARAVRLRGVPDEGPVLAIASVTMPKPPVNGDLARSDHADRHRALRAAAWRSGDGRPFRAVVGQGAGFDRGTIRPQMRGLRKAWSFLARVAAWSVSGSVLGTLAFSEAARRRGRRSCATPRWAWCSPVAASGCASSRCRRCRDTRGSGSGIR